MQFYPSNVVWDLLGQKLGQVHDGRRKTKQEEREGPPPGSLWLAVCLSSCLLPREHCPLQSLKNRHGMRKLWFLKYFFSLKNRGKGLKKANAKTCVRDPSGSPCKNQQLHIAVSHPQKQESKKHWAQRDSTGMPPQHGMALLL